MNKLPRIFIASSSENHDLASACNQNLDRCAEGTVWSNVFEPGGSTLASLTNTANNVDFALFIFSPDDLTRIRGESKLTIRDNILFELGLFIGAIGQERCFILKPRNIKDLHIPTDILNLNTQTYNNERLDDLVSVVNAACFSFQTQMKKLGFFNTKTNDFIKSERHEHRGYVPNDDNLFLFSLLLSTASGDSPMTKFQIENEYMQKILNQNSSSKQLSLNIGLIKLEQANLIERKIDCDYNGNEYVGFQVTSDGIEFAISNEQKIHQAVKSLTTEIPF
ncbi:TIR domain-containing protein [Aeromonas veronii]|uniref:TIR domain-containing protein n=2 Tax=Aeromonadaceae TaxID=84642 RepID=UPI00191F883B|nr:MULTISPECIES: nucleotide-binding protein [Aeromonas]MBL0452138.1 nucleotide-binding protein [Aeromonas veronii]MEB5667479.1 nucleotide-binding protein [Aeromonas veronii]HDX8427771.1 nucleotide-binding protein [Aeromonas veronii]